MSSVFNLIGGGASGSGDDGILFMHSKAADGVGVDFVASGSCAYGSGVYSSTVVRAATGSYQYAYVRVGPVDLSAISTIGADVSTAYVEPINVRPTTTSALFVSDNAYVTNFGSVEANNKTSIQHVNTIAAHDLLTLDVSALSGQYYIYAGIYASDNTSQGRAGYIYSIQAQR